MNYLLCNKDVKECLFEAALDIILGLTSDEDTCQRLERQILMLKRLAREKNVFISMAQEAARKD